MKICYCVPSWFNPSWQIRIPKLSTYKISHLLSGRCKCKENLKHHRLKKPQFNNENKIKYVTTNNKSCNEKDRRREE